ncbi:phage tail protein [Bradyrhizobium sp. INPA03-11B]|uniref:phage tail protein n=1 Tax=Bradyrhizobium sp. INPA03-11B TaxID=418598 RepID=UPI00338DF75A
MVSTFTPNIQLEEPARGDDVGVWDQPVNNNMTVIDLVAGAQSVIPLNNSNIVLSAAQFQSKGITFNSTLTGNVTITFPTSFQKSYEIFNNCSGTGSFTITLQSTIAGGAKACPPPGEICDVVNIGGNLVFKNLGRVGEYWDYAGASLPGWVSGSVPPPYLLCDGSGFSAASYPVLAVVLGGTTLPDARGRARWTLNGGTGRVTAGVSGIDGNTRFTGGGDQSLQTHNHVINVNDPGHSHPVSPVNQVTALQGSGGAYVAYSNAGPSAGVTATTAFTGVNANSNVAGAGAAQNMPPAYIGGITMIRAG